MLVAVVFLLIQLYISQLSAPTMTFRLLIQRQSLHISTDPLGEAVSLSLQSIEVYFSKMSSEYPIYLSLNKIQSQSKRNNMKLPLILIMVGLLSLVSCSKEEKKDIVDSCSKGSGTFSSTSGTTLYLTKQDWYLKRNSIGGGNINVGLSGTTNGDSITILTRGDGLFYYYKIALDSEKHFNQDISISFTANSVPSGILMESTNILVFKGSDTLRVALESCPLSYE